MAGRTSLDTQWFEEFYARNGQDPWGFVDRWYERRKRALTLACLPRERFRRAFEPGCAIGVLTAELAPRCDELLATDVVPAAVGEARRRTGHHLGVRVEQASIRQEWPDGRFDLVVLSELGYYCDADDLQRVAVHAAASLTDDGVLVACHWRHRVPEYPSTGDEVHRVLRDQPRLAVLAHRLEEDFAMDVVPAPAVSVARAQGLLGAS